jgi:hypothetical protein
MSQKAQRAGSRALLSAHVGCDEERKESENMTTATRGSPELERGPLLVLMWCIVLWAGLFDVVVLSIR